MLELYIQVLHDWCFILQAVEFFGEWSLCPQNVAFLRVQTSVFDPLLIGDKAKWFANQLQPITFCVYDDNSTLGAALSSVSDGISDDYPTGKSKIEENDINILPTIKLFLLV